MIIATIPPLLFTLFAFISQCDLLYRPTTSPNAVANRIEKMKQTQCTPSLEPYTKQLPYVEGESCLVHSIFLNTIVVLDFVK